MVFRCLPVARFRVYVLTGCLAIIFLRVRAQEASIDSLKNALNNTTTTAGKAQLLIRLAKTTGRYNPGDALHYSRRARTLAIKEGLIQEHAEVMNVLGNLYYATSKFDSSMIAHREALLVAERIKKPDIVIQAYQGIAQNFIREINGDSAEYYLNKALATAVGIKDQVAVGGIYNSLGNLAIDVNEFKIALDNYIKAADIFEKIPSQQSMFAKALINIANVENILGEHDKAIDYANRGMNVFLKNQDSTLLAYGYKLKGRIYRKMGKYNEALKESEEAARIYQHTGNIHQLAENYLGAGNIYFDMKDFLSAIRAYHKSLILAKSLKDDNQLAYIYSALGSASYEVKSYRNAIAYIDTCFIASKRIHNRYLVMDGYQTLASLYKDQGNEHKAFEMLSAYTELKDSLAAEENRQTLTEMETKYQTSQKQAQIELLQKKQQLRLSQLRQSKIMIVTLIITVILMVAIVYLAFIRYRLKNKLLRQSIVERIRQQISKDLHDDIGSTLSSIHIISQVAIQEKKPDQSEKHFQIIGEQSSRMLEVMSDIVWSINPSNDSMERMVIRLREFCSEILEPRGISFLFEGDEKLTNFKITLERRKNIYLILKEFVNNAAKYSDADRVVFAFDADDKKMIIRVSDNGKGFDQGLVKAGNGLHNMKDRARDIRVGFEFSTTPGLGTSMSLTITP